MKTLKQECIDIPFIVVTGAVGEEAAVECLRMGATDYVLKDRLARLPSAVRQALKEKALSVERDRALEQTRRLATIVESSSEAIISASKEGFITFWNKGAEAVYGYSVDEVLGKPLTLLTPSERKGETVSILERLAKGEVIRRFETQRIRKDGSLIDVSINVFPIVDSLGRITGTAGFIRDISEEKRAKDELLFKTALLEAQSETTIDGILVVDPTGHIVLSNRQFAEMLNIPEDVMRTKNDKRLIEYALTQQKDPDAFLERVNYLIAHETEKSQDEVESKDGRVFDRYSSPLQDSKGKNYGRIWYFRDITERKRAEEALRQSEERLLLACEAADAGLWDLDIPTGQAYVSPYYLPMLGYAVGELPSTYETWLQLLHPDDRDRMMSVVQKRIEEKDENDEVEFRLKAKTGEWRWILGRGRVIASDRRGKSRRMVGVHVDITERKRAEELLRESEAKYRALIETTGTGYVIIDTEGRVLDANAEYVRLTGHGALHEILGRRVTEWTAQHDIARNAEAVKRCAEQGFIRNLEIEHANGDGKCTPMEINATVVPAAEGIRIRCLLQRHHAAQADGGGESETGRAIPAGPETGEHRPPGRWGGSRL